MEAAVLPVLRCNATCHSCGVPSEFAIFESGTGGDFATYFGDRTGSLYRLALGEIQYAGESIETLLAPAILREGGADALRLLPEQVKCKACGDTFAARSMLINREETLHVYQL